MPKYSLGCGPLNGKQPRPVGTKCPKTNKRKIRNTKSRTHRTSGGLKASRILDA
ncbi:hypothetical protein CC1G_14379 [Coprinopsis cinerea okayama7|uniref:Uncharacterized protein n=1 Tax=Coprinopsis cinerea (strain Okayama-7 / 130 / ATCC MYA-4618 / FGSC 9003) TaxID=240176 RepID=D6RM11_COPC7|nr:hypothetical protein CC1G_14379 [Coprinopsis cinerea okayama7\|eukprot:XP_002911382.1 hypothetical protein CC1G_14379 [Coprinopsis cinerea okayama7\